MKTVDHTPSNLRIAAMLKREALIAMATSYDNSPQGDEDDLAVDNTLRAHSILHDDDTILEIFIEDGDLMAVLESGEGISINLATGSVARGWFE